MKTGRVVLLTMVALLLAVTGCKKDDPQRVDVPVTTIDAVGEIGFLQWSPDGTRLAGASQADRLSVWDVESGETVFAYAFDAWLGGLCWTYDGEQLVAGFESGDLVVWDPATGEELRRRSHNPEAWGRANGFTAVACSPTSPLIATGQLAGDFAIWDSSDWDAGPRPIQQYRWPVDGLIWRPDGAYIGETHFTTLNMWRIADYTVIQELGGIAGDSTHMAFSPDGASLVVGNAVGGVNHWNIITGEKEMISSGSVSSNHYGGQIVGVGWSPAGHVFASASNNGRIIIWEAATNHRLFFLRTPRRIASMDWSPTADVLAMGGRHEIMLMDLSDILPEPPEGEN
ncbi:MAG TPA: WD40 repeat domain-containing protein [Anaerolineales bacterium]|nr:WD40 repeat domain-containing protein [Anaerolineae bacterium]HIQ02381.1 WD40 repeat domain-containing protein [Anaerolineales bacterium]